MRARDYPLPHVEIRCDYCGRYGKYTKARFMDIVGPDTELPQGLEIVSSDCPEHRPSATAVHGNCKPYYVGDLWTQKSPDRGGRGE